MAKKNEQTIRCSFCGRPESPDNRLIVSAAGKAEKAAALILSEAGA